MTLRTALHEQLILKWRNPWFVGMHDMPDRDVIRLEAKRECADELAAPEGGEGQLITPENWNDKKWYPSKDQEYLVAAPEGGEGQLAQCDRDRANELEQKLGTLAEDYKAICPQPTVEQMQIFSQQCNELTAQLFAQHRLAALLAAPGEGEGQHGQCHSLSACPCCYGTPEAHKKVTKHCLYCEHAAAPTPRQSEPEGLKAILLKYRDSLVLNHDVGDRNIHYESLSNELFALVPSATEKGQGLRPIFEQGIVYLQEVASWWRKEGRESLGATCDNYANDLREKLAALGTTEKPQLCGHRFLAAGDKQLGIEPAYVDPPCELSSGHEGQHKAENDLGTVSWGR